MGGCLTRDNKGLARKSGHEPHRIFAATDELEAKSKFDGGGQMGRLRVRREGRIVNVEPKGEVLRIKLVVTQEELKQILKYKEEFEDSSVEQLVTAMKLRPPRVCDDVTIDDRINSDWRPALESIPEDQ